MKNKRAVLYVRVSTEEQALDGYSIAGQVQNLMDYCRKNDFTVVEIYKDEGLSAKSTDRPALQLLLEDTKKISLICSSFGKSLDYHVVKLIF
ncbi:recombinase family protein [Planococcus halotolerans]|uniref:Resolvase/invertase-type recombinase catalytic domain-containing protein n=1 Tax=Planococcus halotolerans TaxID=2233542 RepID=A0A365L7W5_9BACL|nr:recombinase family protein [Planococcus halotolerans]RAZ81526.1 hypothetical protein DP120_04430 [Planococcus halotolerans]